MNRLNALSCVGGKTLNIFGGAGVENHLEILIQFRQKSVLREVMDKKIEFATWNFLLKIYRLHSIKICHSWQ